MPKSTQSLPGSSSQRSVKNGDSSAAKLKKEKLKDDISILMKSISTSVTSLQEIIKLFKNATPEVIDLITNECSIILECKICKNLFRSLANFMTHKRGFCLGKFEQLFQNHEHGDHVWYAKCRENKVLSSRSTTRKDILNLLEAMKGSVEREVSEITVLKELEPTNEALFNIRYDAQDSSKDKDRSATIYPEETNTNLTSATAVTAVEETHNTNTASATAAAGATTPQHPSPGVASGGTAKSESVSATVTTTAVSAGSPLSNASDSNHRCNHCGKDFTSSKLLAGHLKKDHEDLRICFVCPCCKKYFSNSWCVYRHMYKVHRKTNEQVRKLRNQIQKKQVRLEEIERAKKGQHSSPIEERDPERAFMEDLKGHGSLQHCSECGKKFDRKVALIAHAANCVPTAGANKPPTGGPASGNNLSPPSLVRSLKRKALNPMKIGGDTDSPSEVVVKKAKYSPEEMYLRLRALDARVLLSDSIVKIKNEIPDLSYEENLQENDDTTYHSPRSDEEINYLIEAYQSKNVPVTSVNSEFEELLNKIHMEVSYPEPICLTDSDQDEAATTPDIADNSRECLSPSSQNNDAESTSHNNHAESTSHNNDAESTSHKNDAESTSHNDDAESPLHNNDESIESSYDETTLIQDKSSSEETTIVEKKEDNHNVSKEENTPVEIDDKIIVQENDDVKNEKIDQENDVSQLKDPQNSKVIQENNVIIIDDDDEETNDKKDNVDKNVKSDEEPCEFDGFEEVDEKNIETQEISYECTSILFDMDRSCDTIFSVHVDEPGTKKDDCIVLSDDEMFFGFSDIEDDSSHLPRQFTSITRHRDEILLKNSLEESSSESIKESQQNDDKSLVKYDLDDDNNCIVAKEIILFNDSESVCTFSNNSDENDTLDEANTLNNKVNGNCSTNTSSSTIDDEDSDWINRKINSLINGDKKHKNKRKRICLLCSKTFPTLSFVRRHVASHYNINKFKCLVNSCKFQSFLRSDMDHHVLRVHKKKEPETFVGRLYPKKEDFSDSHYVPQPQIAYPFFTSGKNEKRKSRNSSSIFLDEESRGDMNLCEEVDMPSMDGRSPKILRCWGDLGYKREIPDTLQAVDLRVVEMTRLIDSLSFLKSPHNTKSRISTFTVNKDICQGDSGGPLIYRDPEVNRWVQVGIIVAGGVCINGSALPVVHTDVLPYFDWIQKMVGRTTTCEKIEILQRI